MSFSIHQNRVHLLPSSLKSSTSQESESVAETDFAELSQDIRLINDRVSEIRGLDGGNEAIPYQQTRVTKTLFGEHSSTEKSLKPQKPQEPSKPGFWSRLLTGSGAQYQREMQDFQEAKAAWPGEIANWKKGGLDRALEEGKVVTNSQDNRFILSAVAEFGPENFSAKPSSTDTSLPTGLKSLDARWDSDALPWDFKAKSLKFRHEDGKDIYNLVKRSDHVSVLRKHAGDVYTRLDQHVEIIADHKNGTLTYSTERRKADHEPYFFPNDGPPESSSFEDTEPGRLRMSTDGTASYEIMEGTRVHSNGTSSRELWDGHRLNTDGTGDVNLGKGWSYNTERGLKKTWSVPGT